MALVIEILVVLVLTIGISTKLQRIKYNLAEEIDHQTRILPFLEELRRTGGHQTHQESPLRHSGGS